jgi:hypothetical protein
LKCAYKGNDVAAILANLVCSTDTTKVLNLAEGNLYPGSQVILFGYETGILCVTRSFGAFPSGGQAMIDPRQAER